MIKLIDIKKWLFWSAFAALIVLSFVPELKRFTAHHMPALLGLVSLLEHLRVIALVVAFVLSLVFVQWVWRLAWKVPLLGASLQDSIFPDLNGEWEVSLKSNWPIIDKMRMTSAGLIGEKFDVLGSAAAFPPLLETKFRGEIYQSWFKVGLKIHPNKTNPLRESHTISFDLIRGSTTDVKQVSWIFCQINKEVAATDEDDFEGAALLTLGLDGSLHGTYWNNRSWRRGLNAAGTIEMRRVKPPKKPWWRLGL